MTLRMTPFIYGIRSFAAVPATGPDTLQRRVCTSCALARHHIQVERYGLVLVTHVLQTGDLVAGRFQFAAERPIVEEILVQLLGGVMRQVASVRVQEDLFE